MNLAGSECLVSAIPGFYLWIRDSFCVYVANACQETSIVVFGLLGPCIWVHEHLYAFLLPQSTKHSPYRRTATLCHGVQRM